MDGINLKVRTFEMEHGKYELILHNKTAAALGVRSLDRVKVSTTDDEPITAIIDTTDSAVAEDEVGIFAEIAERFDLEGGEVLNVRPADKPQSIRHIRAKMRGEKLDREAIDGLVCDVVDGSLSDIELSAWVTSLEIQSMDMEEIEHLTRSMVKYGETMNFDNGIVFDKHSIGGVPGNKITLLVVPIVASQGLLIPKTSSRAVTGAAGTADVMEVFCNVQLNGEEIKRITRKVGGVMCWGGGVNLAPADDIIIRVEHPLSLDPTPQLLASVMSKKKAVGAQRIVMDLPMGEGTKLKDENEARKLARMFIELGERLDMRVECAVTYGGQPVGKSVGCALEAREALAALRGEESAPRSLIEKSTAIAGILLEMGDVVGRGKGKAKAEEILRSGAALTKFTDIVEAQGGGVPKGEIPVGKYTQDIISVDGGYVSGMTNRALVAIARAAGSPRDLGAGLVVHFKRGDKVEAGEALMTLHSASEYNLEQAVTLAKRLAPIRVEGMLIERIPDFREL